MPTALLPTLLLAGTLGGTSGAQESQESRLVQADARFARELAARFSYVDLAEEVISGIDRTGLAREDVARLELLECNIYAMGARSEPSARKRLELYDKALQRYEAFLEANPSGAILSEAQQSYVSLVDDYGRSLEVELDAAIGAEAAALRERMTRILERGVDLTAELIAGSSASLSEAQKQERWRSMLSRGRILLTLARVSDPGANLSDLFGQAERILEDLALEAGETSGPGLNAYLTLAEVKAARADYASARDFADFVYGVALPEGETRQAEYGWKDATRAEKAGRFGLAELALPTLIDARIALGETAEACRSALHFHDTWKREELELSPRGYLACLSVARLLLDAGGSVAGAPEKGDLAWYDSEESAVAAGRAPDDLQSALELALALAEEVSAKNRGNTLQVRAQRVISDIISRPGVSVSPDLLFEAAQGEYFAKEHAKAIESLKGVLRVLATKERAVQEALTPKVLHFLGSALVGMERHLEAAMAFREGAKRWKSDPEYREKLARGFYAEMGVLQSEIGNDPLIAKLYLEAETLLSDAAASSSDRGRILLQQAERKYRDEQDYAGARVLYSQIEANSDVWEKGQAMAALCLYKQGDFEGAAEEFGRYLDRVADATRPTAGDARASREEARAIATFYLGRIAYEAGDWPRVIERLGSFDRAFPEQSDYGPNALYMVVLAHVAQGEVTIAMAVVDRMRETFGGHAKTGAAAIQLFQALEAEQEEATQAGDEERAEELRGEMAEYLRAANELTESPKFQNLRSEASLWIELGRVQEAEATLRRTLALFRADARSERDVQRYVLPDLGAVLLAQKRVPEAFEVLDPLVPAEPAEGRKPSASVVRSWCRAVTGWVEDQGAGLVEVPGVGGPENFPRAAAYLNQLIAAEKREGAGDWSCPWYELTFELAYANYQWARIDSTKREATSRILQSLLDLLGDERYADVTAKCGDAALERRFTWLSGKVR